MEFSEGMSIVITGPDCHLLVGKTVKLGKMDRDGRFDLGYSLETKWDHGTPFNRHVLVCFDPRIHEAKEAA